MRRYLVWVHAHLSWNLALMLLSLPCGIVGLAFESHRSLLGQLLTATGVVFFLVGAAHVFFIDRLPAAKTCSRCGDKGYLVNEGLRVLEDCPLCQPAAEETSVVPLRERKRHSALAERSA